jgi:hypothetical protein
MTVDFINDKNQDVRLNYTFNILRDIYSAMAYIAVNSPKYDGDVNYQKQIFKTTFDLVKALKGVNGNFMTKALFEKALESMDFEIKFPLKKVSHEITYIAIMDLLPVLIHRAFTK